MTDKKVNNVTSYTSADTIPIKLILDDSLVEAVKENKIIPIHVQLIPTNKCNLNCFFCSCNKRDKNLELSWEKLMEIMDKFKALGMKAVTITGGGEPLLYKYFEALVKYLDYNDIKMGLVTNGLKLWSFVGRSALLSKLTWCRISSGDDRGFPEEYAKKLSVVILENPGVDWAFSHVVGVNPNKGTIVSLVKFANKHNFTHVRFVADLFNPEGADMSVVSGYLAEDKIDQSRVIYQARKDYVQGKDCYICYLKPLVGPDGKIYACCGVQYALETASKDLPSELSIGDSADIEKIIEKSNIPFDGSKCVKCYYDNYNIILKGMLSEIKHKEFV